jgi:hypothetical protein
MNQPKNKVAAQLIITRPGGMTTRGRNQIARWLRVQANVFSKYGGKYTDTGRFTARYLYTPHNKP